MTNKPEKGPKRKLEYTWRFYLKTVIPWLVIGLGLAFYFSGYDI